MFSFAMEYVRQVKLKQIFVDHRQTFKIFVILRYLYVVLVITPTLIVLYYRMYMQSVVFIIFCVALAVQESVVLLLVFLKIARGSVPAKVQYIQERFGQLDVPKAGPEPSVNCLDESVASIPDQTQIDMLPPSPAQQRKGNFARAPEEKKTDARNRVDSDTSVNCILAQFQNEKSFFEMTRPRIQSEFSPQRTRQVEHMTPHKRQNVNSFHSKRTKISIAYSVNSDVVINEDVSNEDCSMSSFHMRLRYHLESPPRNVQEYAPEMRRRLGHVHEELDEMGDEEV